MSASNVQTTSLQPANTPSSFVDAHALRGSSMKFFVALACFLALAYASSSAHAAKCTFEILVKTGERKNAGTDARVSLQVSGASGKALVIKSLKSWGQMGAAHNYFERSNLDRFKGTGECLRSAPCKMLLSTDGSGHKPGWYVNYVQVTQRGQGVVSSKTHRWVVNQWLAVTAAPRKLSAFKNDCDIAAALP